MIQIDFLVSTTFAVMESPRFISCEDQPNAIIISPASLRPYMFTEIDELTPPTFNAPKKLLVPPNNPSDGYLWDKTVREPADEYDRLFLANKAERVRLFGYHSYGGYAGFFRPDLHEVSQIIEVNLDRYPELKSSVLFVTTLPCDEQGVVDYNIGRCYDPVGDVHRAVTIVYYLPK